MKATPRRAKLRNAKKRKPDPADASTWPVIWRVMCPRAGSFNHDMVFAETDDEAHGKRLLRMMRRAKYPARLERVQCGPLPKGGGVARLQAVRDSHPQNDRDKKLPPILGLWEAR